MGKNAAFQLSGMVTVMRLLTIFTDGSDLEIKLILFFLIAYLVKVLRLFSEGVLVFVEMLEFKAEF